MEDVWRAERKKVDILQELIHAIDSEPVLRAIADWQKDVMEHGGHAGPLVLDGGPEGPGQGAVFYEG